MCPWARAPGEPGTWGTSLHPTLTLNRRHVAAVQFSNRCPNLSPSTLCVCPAHKPPAVRKSGQISLPSTIVSRSDRYPAGHSKYSRQIVVLPALHPKAALIEPDVRPEAMPCYGTAGSAPWCWHFLPC